MIADLPKQVPVAVHAAVEDVLSEFERLDGNRSVAASAYRAQMQLNRLQIAPFNDALSVERADALFEWGMMLRSALPADRLREALKSVHRSSLMLISHQINLKEEETAPAGALKTTLDLEIIDDSLLFRHHAWFGAYRVAGGGGLSSSTSIQMSIHAEMLRQIHNRVAEGDDIWRRVIYSVKKLLEDSMDR
ncbi:MAG: hypothetical protein WC866_04490 [Patescibacteria group bacterium]|jgi:hypothetical protein